MRDSSFCIRSTQNDTVFVILSFRKKAKNLIDISQKSKFANLQICIFLEFLRFAFAKLRMMPCCVICKFRQAKTKQSNKNQNANL